MFFFVSGVCSTFCRCLIVFVLCLFRSIFFFLGVGVGEGDGGLCLLFLFVLIFLFGLFMFG